MRGTKKKNNDPGSIRPSLRHILNPGIQIPHAPMNRRNFLMLSGLAGGSCLIPVAIARRIHDVCIGASQPLILTPDRFLLELYAQECDGRYHLHLGNPEDEWEYPTLREFMERRSFDPDDDKSLREAPCQWLFII